MQDGKVTTGEVVGGDHWQLQAVSAGHDRLDLLLVGPSFMEWSLYWGKNMDFRCRPPGDQLGSGSDLAEQI